MVEDISCFAVASSGMLVSVAVVVPVAVAVAAAAAAVVVVVILVALVFSVVVVGRNPSIGRID